MPQPTLTHRPIDTGRPTDRLLVERGRLPVALGALAARGLHLLRPHPRSPLGHLEFVAMDPSTLELAHVDLAVRGPIAAGAPSSAAAPARVPASGGLCIAFLGCDGSGKSTVTREIRRWLAVCLDVDFVYLGSGQGSSSLLRWPLLLLHRLVTRWRSRRRSRSDGPGDDRALGPGRLRELLRPLWALLLALEKRQKLARAWRQRRRGTIVVCDRYPQNQIEGFNDGPLLADWQRGAAGLRRAVAAWEREPYRRAEQCPPDLVVKLHVSPEVACRRKPDMTAAEVQRRIAAVDALEFAGAAVLRVDADAPLAEVLATVKRAIWEAL